jgi:hypothetical protein
LKSLGGGFEMQVLDGLRKYTPYSLLQQTFAWQSMLKIVGQLNRAEHFASVSLKHFMLLQLTYFCIPNLFNFHISRIISAWSAQDSQASVFVLMFG